MASTLTSAVPDIDSALQFLAGPTPSTWLDAAMDNVPLLLIDHAHCEKKAASTALNLMFRYVDRPELLTLLAQLAREELLHFEQVLELLQRHEVVYDHLSPSRYAAALRAHIRTTEPGRLIDTLVVGAFIEARSCERFAALAPRLEASASLAGIGRYYRFLLKSESRHYADYLALARQYGAAADVEARIEHLRAVEWELVTAVDTEFRFHSGPPSL